MDSTGTSHSKHGVGCLAAPRFIDLAEVDARVEWLVDLNLAGPDLPRASSGPEGQKRQAFRFVPVE